MKREVKGRKLPFGYIAIKQSDLTKLPTFNAKAQGPEVFLDGKKLKNVREVESTMERIDEAFPFKRYDGDSYYTELVKVTTGYKWAFYIRTRKGKKK